MTKAGGLGEVLVGVERLKLPQSSWIFKISQITRHPFLID
jgi:hypothetical protein